MKRRIFPLIPLSLFLLLFTFNRDLYAQTAAGHAKEGIGHLEEAIRHLEESIKAGGNPHAKEAIEHIREAIKHAEESIAQKEVTPKEEPKEEGLDPGGGY